MTVVYAKRSECRAGTPSSVPASPSQARLPPLPQGTCFLDKRFTKWKKTRTNMIYDLLHV